MLRSCSAVLTLASVCLVALNCTAQQTRTSNAATVAPLSYGTVTGHVYFAGSNAPARLVNIALQPIGVDAQDTFHPGRVPPLSFTVYQTGLDGSYTIPQVAAGTYYVVVTEPGFLSPFTQFTVQQMAHPTPEVAQKMAETLPVVAVRPNATSTLDISLQRGAGISGTVRFDDGTPYVAAGVFVQRRIAGKWVSTSSYSNRAIADADGHWAVSGLPAGEYRLRVILSVNERKQSALLGDSSASTGYDKYTLAFYSGDTARERDEQVLKLDEGQQLNGEDLTIPVSRLHAIEGAVVDATTGAALNAGQVELHYADDNSYLVSTAIDSDSRTFTFNFVPEGQYKLVIHNAREVRFEPPPPEDFDPNFPDRNRRSTTLRQYGPGEIPLMLQGETSGVTIPVQLKSTDAQ